jgi:hypothetical protein
MASVPGSADGNPKVNPLFHEILPGDYAPMASQLSLDFDAAIKRLDGRARGSRRRAMFTGSALVVVIVVLVSLIWAFVVSGGVAEVSLAGTEISLSVCPRKGVE